MYHFLFLGGALLFHFIPAWQNSQVSKTDDMLSQIKMFQSVSESIEVWVREYLPNLRTFLFLENMTEIPYKSLYDEMQNIHQNYENKVDVYDLNWPEDVSFYYSQFGVFVLRENQRYAKVSFDSLNNMERIEFYHTNQQVAKKCLFDDRGFISSIEYFVEDQLIKKEFYNESFELQFCVDYQENQKVTLGVENRQKYQRDTFETLEEFTKFVLELYLKDLSVKDVVVMAMDNQIVPLIDNIDSIQSKKVASIFSHRKFDYSAANVVDWLSKMTLVITDNHQMQKEIQSLNLDVPVEVITPYDAVLKLGESQRVAYYLIHFVYHGLPTEEINPFLYQLLKWNQQYKWHFAIDCLNPVEVDPLKEHLKNVIATFFEVDLSLVNECTAQMDQELENALVDEKADETIYKKMLAITKVLKQITIERFNDKEELLAGLLHTRVLVDLAEQPDVLRQICGISTGIPMVNRVDTGYVIHQQNGWLIENKDELEKVLLYYLTGLRHWNESLVYSVAQLNRYTNGAIVNRWKEWLEIGED